MISVGPPAYSTPCKENREWGAHLATELYESTFDLPVWPFGGFKLPVPTAIVAGGAEAILPWIGDAVGGGAGSVVVRLLSPFLSSLLGDIEDLTISISGNGRVRIKYHMEGDCDHPTAEKWMNYCPDCGVGLQWEAGKNPPCPNCAAPSHDAFNYCWACQQDFGLENTPRAKAKGYKLELDCDNDDCDGKIAAWMAYCPWCSEEQLAWSFDDEAECSGCDCTISADWSYCAFCGAEP